MKIHLEDLYLVASLSVSPATVGDLQEFRLKLVVGPELFPGFQVDFLGSQVAERDLSLPFLKELHKVSRDYVHFP